MEKILRGKYLVRKSFLKDGSEVITVAGVFYPQNFEFHEIENDEMWVSDIHIYDGIKYKNPDGIVGSPEDFLRGDHQSPNTWKNKEKF